MNFQTFNLVTSGGLAGVTVAVIDNQQKQGSHIYRTVQCRADLVVRIPIMVRA